MGICRCCVMMLYSSSSTAHMCATCLQLEGRALARCGHNWNDAGWFQRRTPSQQSNGLIGDGGFTLLSYGSSGTIPWSQNGLVCCVLFLATCGAAGCGSAALPSLTAACCISLCYNYGFTCASAQYASSGGVHGACKRHLCDQVACMLHTTWLSPAWGSA